jgi:hypothetical protein
MGRQSRRKREARARAEVERVWPGVDIKAALAEGLPQLNDQQMAAAIQCAAVVDDIEF